MAKRGPAQPYERTQPLMRVRVLIADDHQLVVEGVVALLRSSFDVVGTASSGQELLSEATRLAPDVIVADITMPGLTGIEAAHQLMEAGSTAKFVFLTIHPEGEFIAACMAEGALGYILKSHMKTDLIPAINAAISGRTFISPGVSR